MSHVVKSSIECDGSRCIDGSSIRMGEHVREARARLYQQGWRTARKGGRTVDYCPSHAKELIR